jgi:hypothetical protein
MHERETLFFHGRNKPLRVSFVNGFHKIVVEHTIDSLAQHLLCCTNWPGGSRINSIVEHHAVFARLQVVESGFLGVFLCVYLFGFG